jgi:16S rRNA (guanine1207-N2)-methyltransferase
MDAGAFDVVPAPRILLVNPPIDLVFEGDATGYGDDATTVAALRSRGMPILEELGGEWDVALLFLPRAKAYARHLMASVLAHCDVSRVVIDGPKTNGIETFLKDIRKDVTLVQTLSKAHGKIAWFDVDPTQTIGFEPGTLEKNADGFYTFPGAFSQNGIDNASAALISCLPDTLGKHVVDLGAGWGFLAHHALSRAGIERLDLVESFQPSVMSAQKNIADTRAVFHWADALAWKPETLADTVIMNPPFHTGRTADPDLGRDFIRKAAQILKPKGRLLLVANRHLPYETTLTQEFQSVQEIGGTSGFKVIFAERPKRRK